MAEALAIVGEAGIHGMSYNPLDEMLVRQKNSRRSQRFRVSVCPSHEFTRKEFEDYMILAWRFGFVDRSKYQELESKAGTNKSSYDLDDEEIRLTREGWEFIDKNGAPILHRWWRTFVEHIPHILMSIIAAALTSWAILFWGAPS
jgi:hypothetical protein